MSLVSIFLSTKRKLIKLGYALILLSVLPLVAHADPVSLVLTNPQQTAIPGSTLIFGGAVSNTTAESFTLGYQATTQFGLTWNPALPFTLGAFSQTGNITFFSAFIHDHAFSGVYDGIFTVRYTSTLTGLTNQVDVPYQITVVGGATPTPVPEPATIFLLGTGLAGAAATYHRGRRAKSS